MDWMAFMLRFACFALVFAALAPIPARAQADPDPQHVARLVACLEPTQTKAQAQSCVGPIANDCMYGEGGRGDSTAGMRTCAAVEASAWRALLHRYAGELRARETPTQVQRLEEFLAQGERWETAQCRYQASFYEGGTLSNVTFSFCVLDSIAARALELYARLHYEG